ncbi:hypothetical protein [Legionella gresilensis]|uniref:hypothetical protein n=1 Tax=Legionella gresilensis TaxID=91823 RepID=UPI0010411D2B|nr:hypothetical protein [Legionella gresilensis]
MTSDAKQTICFEKLWNILQNFDLSNEKNVQLALTLVGELSQADFERPNSIGTHLFDLTIFADNFEIANAIIAKYAQLTNNIQLKPLTIDFNNNDTFLQLYHLNSLPPIMCRFSVPAYITLIDLQKEKYIQSIKEEIKNLKIIGAVKFLELFTDIELKGEVLKQSFVDRVHSVDLNEIRVFANLNKAIKQTINQAKKIDYQQLDSYTEKIAIAAINVADDLERLADEFLEEQRDGPHKPLSVFINQIMSYLKLSDAWVSKCCEIEEILMRLVDKIENIEINKVKGNDAENQVTCIKAQEMSSLGFFSNRAQRTEQVEKFYCYSISLNHT